jgi:endonuclease/exonuclease/phosphatase family metal-dependent hydrolase
VRLEDPAVRPASEIEFSVLTQNAWGGVGLWDRRCEALSQRIRSLRPAVIGLQEIHAASVEEGCSQASEIATLASGYRAWFAPGRVTPSGACEGVALLCREDIDVIERSIEALTLDRSDPFEGEHQRIVLRAAIGWHGAVIDVLVTHLSLSQRARTRTVRELLSFAEREREKSGSVGAVLMGDFNAPPSEEAIAGLCHGEHGWLDTFRHVHGEAPGGTWPAGFPLRRIDYVFVQPADRWIVTRCDRLPFSGSDHLGVMAWLDLAHPNG